MTCLPCKPAGSTDPRCLSKRTVLRRGAAALCGEALLFVLVGCRAPAPKPQPSVLLVTLEGVRADHLGSYGHAIARTPHLDALAREGAEFEQAYSAAPLCLPAVTTVLTGRSPRSHGVHLDADVSLGPNVPVLAEAFRAHGYRTGGFVGTRVLGRASGLSRGFDTFVDEFGTAEKPAGRPEAGTTEETVEAALRWLLANQSPGPVFLWAHVRRAAPEPAPKNEAVEELYDASLAATDQELGRLLDAARRPGLPLVVAVAADHGEALGDHGEQSFGYFLYSATTRVPLIVLASLPGIAPGARLRPVVRTMDLAPTLLDLAGLPPLAAPGEGVSLVPLLAGRATEGPGPAAIENASLERRYGFSPLFAVRSGSYLYVRAPHPELYDVEQDPAEKDDAHARLSKVAQRLDTELARFAPETPPGLMDPKDGLPLYNRYREALDLEARGERGRASLAYRSVLKEAPGFVFAERKLAESLLRDNKTAEAQHLLADLVSRQRGDETTYLNLALTHFRAGDREGALHQLREGIRAFPASAALRYRAGRLLLDAKRPSEALPELAKAVELLPRFADGQLALAEALEALGRSAEAGSVYRRVLEIAAPAAADAAQANAGLSRLHLDPR
jgi:choline-sulfatase